MYDYKIFPKFNYTDFHFKVLYHDWVNIIYPFFERKFSSYLRQYIILKYQPSTTYFNKLENAIISVMVDNGDDDCFVNLYSELNDIYPEEIIKVI